MIIGQDRYSVKHPSPEDGWSFDNSASLNSSQISEELQHSFSNFVGSKLEFLYSAHSRIVTKAVIVIPVSGLIMLAAYFFMARKGGYFLMNLF
jgi:hypothetical protein